MLATEYVIPPQDLTFLGTLNDIENGVYYIEDPNVENEGPGLLNPKVQQMLTRIVRFRFPNIRRGDTVALLSKEQRLGNNGLLIWDGLQVIDLSYGENIAEEGFVPRQFEVSDIEFNPYYWSKTIAGQPLFWPSQQLVDRAVSSVAFGKVNGINKPIIFTERIVGYEKYEAPQYPVQGFQPQYPVQGFHPRAQVQGFLGFQPQQYPVQGFQPQLQAQPPSGRGRAIYETVQSAPVTTDVYYSAFLIGNRQCVIVFDIEVFEGNVLGMNDFIKSLKSRFWPWWDGKNARNVSVIEQPNYSIFTIPPLFPSYDEGDDVVEEGGEDE